jgi:DNA modification methylase
MKTQTVPISKVKLNPNNPRLIKDDKFKKLVASIQGFPEMLQIRPIVVNADMVVLGGNMRLRACKEAGLKEVPIIVADNIPEDRQAEFIIKDNVGFGEWDWEMLANEWDSDLLADWGLEVPENEVMQLEAEEDDYEMPDEVHTDIVIGDLFEIGEHRLLCGDSTDSDQVAKLMNGEKADMVFTDPPYALFGNSTGASVADDKMIRPFFRDIGIQIKKNSKPIAHFYSCLDWKSWAAVIETYTASGLTVKNMIVWDKGDSGSGGANTYRSLHELIMFGVADNVGTSITKNIKSTINVSSDGNIWRISRENKNGLHGALKPFKIMERAFTNSSKKNDLILDLFLGSGSTMVAAHQLQRKCYGMELDPKYCQVIIDRMLKLDPALPVKRNGQPYIHQS